VKRDQEICYSTPTTSLGVLGASLDTINFASGRTILSSPPPRIPWQSLVRVGQLGAVNTNTGTRRNTNNTTPSNNQSQSSNNGYSSFVGLFNPFLLLITSPSTPSNNSQSAAKK